ncbi:hypothetical protein B6A10_14005 [Flavobacterium sp. L1I52]|uniref:PH domain-containing protein n=1 Tax=Flavobacterium pokkalii TaxID=1940408 RepID=A0ABR7UX12_9FLAO|nr:hypothetical protein [Flavobacterium pokkalii]MBD0726290.1 hypothetical protein [Flavobacterium pokkalii]
MDLVDRQVKVYQTSKKLIFKPLLFWAIIVIIVCAIMGQIELVLFWFAGIVFIGVLGFFISSNLKITIDSDKELVVIDKTNFLDNLIETKTYILNRYHFKITSRKSYKNRINYFFAFRDTHYKGGELYYNENFYTDEYSISGFSKKTVKLIEKDIQKIQDKIHPMVL